MGRPLSKIHLWIIRMYLTSLVLYVVYSIRWLHCKAWLHVCYRSSSSVALYVHQHMIWSQSKFNLCYLHQTSSHNFLCHKHAIIPQKRFHFHFLGHKHVQTILAKSLLSDASVACCFHCILEDSRILLWTVISFECCIKTRIWRYPLPVCNSQCSQGKD